MANHSDKIAVSPEGAVPMAVAGDKGGTVTGVEIGAGDGGDRVHHETSTVEELDQKDKSRFAYFKTRDFYFVLILGLVQHPWRE